MKIDHSRFCGLSGNTDWQNWLKITAPDLHKDLIATRSSGRGCKANKDRMVVIYNQLYARGKGADLEAFISKRFPYLVVDSPSAPPPRPQKPAISMPSRVMAVTNASNLNKHGVFADYRPAVLSWPKKMIFVNKSRPQLEAIVKHFLKDKVSTDWIVVEDRAYVEYFDAAHAAEAEKIARESREIYKYRSKMMESKS